jgi:signal transduction histidine kinase
MMVPSSKITAISSPCVKYIPVLDVRHVKSLDHKISFRTALIPQTVIQNSIGRALAEMRAIASGMCLPELEHLSLVATLGRVIQTHKRRTQSDVTLLIERSPMEVALPIKITAYRIVQESLANAFKHGGGKDQTVRLLATPEEVLLEINDHGFQLGNVLERNERLGLVGMRERAESLGGS